MDKQFSKLEQTSLYCNPFFLDRDWDGAIIMLIRISQKVEQPTPTSGEEKYLLASHDTSEARRTNRVPKLDRLEGMNNVYTPTALLSYNWGSSMR